MIFAPKKRVQVENRRILPKKPLRRKSKIGLPSSFSVFLRVLRSEFQRGTHRKAENF
jgi:hypothetical protein